MAMAAMATTSPTASRISAGGTTQLDGDAVVVEAARGWSSVFVLGKATVEILDRVKPGLGLTMAEQIISLHVELLPEGCTLATSEAIPGLVAQGRTDAETLEIARDVAKRLLEARAERG
jgi:hypothetical protein